MKFQWVLIAGCLLVVGCAESQPDRAKLRGKVTFEGKPVVYGVMNFGPDIQKGNRGAFGTAEIYDGEYETSPDFGPTPGPMIVSIQVHGSKPPDNIMRVLIPRYAVDIPAGTSTWDFHLTAKDVGRIDQ
ncbi:hypothetical protein AYO40_01625 [Planctomycetaceae bacterium SCGC AG-212-D15]|nr:hypothetical protein AYO40_01625 [Planctomycetaceae bacterium SCGC AG-212-D15]